MNVAVKAVKHAAPGPYLGFALQPVRLCFHLLTCPKGAAVSLEHFDDIAIHHADGAVTLEQTKSALKQNPLADWSEDLWKTIANWLCGIAEGQIDPNKSSFQIYVTPPHQGGWAKALNDAASTEDVASLVKAIETKYAKLKKPKSCDAFLQCFLNTSREVRATVVARLKILSEDEDPVNPLRALINTAVVPELVDVLCNSAIGMAKEQADRLIREGKPAIIFGDTFKAEFRAFVQKVNIPSLLTSFTPAPHDDEIAAVLSLRPIFIRQLEIINAAEDDRVRAVGDYLRASADKSAWADSGLVFAGSLSEWDEHLVSRHALICGEVADLHADRDAAVCGRLTYRRCAQLQAPLDGRAVPGHFVHGCFNELANDMRLGWHPNYRLLLNEDEG
ncbi:ABC-three component system protein [Rhodoplanes elegans]|uniref:ABC-three component system protein n=1 Tax=Rhodoplanes elegans TaxID=29408 RepID=UPI0011B93744|nr:ABC-three component system protein [Rhodoplanes elegans]